MQEKDLFRGQYMPHYTEVALWSSTDNADDSGGAPLDDNYSAWDISQDTLQGMRDDLAGFLWQARRTIRSMRVSGMPYADPGAIAHDFWLTRNRHGAGFWDRGNGSQGEALADVARRMGEVYLYIGDDGMIYS